MLREKIIGLINYQIGKELESAYLYLDFANWFSEHNLKGFEHWYKVQAREEIEHAEKFIDYLHDEDCVVELGDLEKIKCSCSSIVDILSHGLEHEKYVTKLINELYTEAENQYDIRTQRFLDWFINEQAEEEKNARDLIDDYETFANGCNAGLYQMDRDLSKR